MDILREVLEDYQKTTIKLIKAVENEDYDLLGELANIRQNEINKMDKIDYSKEQFSKICNELEILSFEKQLETIMKEKRNFLKGEITKFAETKAARQSYTKRSQVDAIYFNKKI